MENLLKLPDNELIDSVYFNIAGEAIRNNISDFSNTNKWFEVVMKMPKPVSLIYRVIIFNQQVSNGGLIQYFDNGYGIFSYDTLKDLKNLKADLFYTLLEEALEIINPENFQGEDFIEYVINRKYETNFKSITKKLNALEEEYYKREYVDILIKKAANYFRTHIQNPSNRT